MPRQRIVVAMSGGVDSSTVAALLKEQGHEVIGVGMRLPVADMGSCPTNAFQRSCCGIEGMEDARRVAFKIGIPFYVLNYEDFFRRSVVDYFCRSYLKGETPNPCVECNRVVKFGRFLELADSLQADYVATGHYARIARDHSTGRYLLLRARDAEKDQSYFLYPLKQKQLARALFPLGNLTKKETRDLARRYGLSVSEKPASQDICFLPGRDYRSFLQKVAPEALQPGPIVDSAGKVLGRHRGVAFFTVGQRRGTRVAAGEPRYVISVDPASATVVIGPRSELQTTHIAVRNVNWIPCEVPVEPMEVHVKLRYRQPELPAMVRAENDRAWIDLCNPQPASAPGQSAVFYDGDTVVGGGIIERPIGPAQNGREQE